MSYVFYFAAVCLLHTLKMTDETDTCCLQVAVLVIREQLAARNQSLFCQTEKKHDMSVL